MMTKNRILVAAGVAIILSVLLANNSKVMPVPFRYEHRIQTILENKQRTLERVFDEYEQAVSNNLHAMIASLDNDGIALLVYRSDTLVFWSSNTIPVYDFYIDSLFSQQIVQLFNSYYYVVNFSKESFRYIGLINVYNAYPYDNDLLISGFQGDFNFQHGAQISFLKGEGLDCYDSQGNYIFSVTFNHQAKADSLLLIISTLFFFLGVLLLGYYLYLTIILLRDRGSNFFALILIGSVVFLRFIQLLSTLNFKGFLLFDPYIYAESLFAPSLGDLIINSLFVFLLAIGIFKTINSDQLNLNKSPGARLLIRITAILLFLLFFIYAHYFSYSLIYNSNISFQPNSFDKLTVYSLLGFLINGINYSSVGIIFITLLQISDLKKNLVDFFKTFLITSALFFTSLFLIFNYPLDIFTIVFFYLLTILIGSLHYSGRDLSRYTPQILFLLLFSIYSFLFVNFRVQEKEGKVRTSLALSLANEHDPVAEYLFEEISEQLRADTLIANQYCTNLLDIYTLPDYLKNNYFSGFWNKYNLQITLCRPQDSVLIESPEYQWFHCYEFFNQIVDEEGFSLPDTRFYYRDNQAGKISYLGQFTYFPPDNSEETTLFIELDSRLSTDFLGYPELLLDKKLHADRLINKYSYAKYFQNNLVAKFGEFSYSLTADLFGEMDSDYKEVKLDGYNHLLYRSEEGNIIVLSQPSEKFIHLLIGFSYIFLFYYISLLILTSVRNLKHSEVRFLGNLRSKIQFSILTILILSLILIAASTIWLSLRNYRTRQYEILQEKIQSVLVELSHKLANEEVLYPDWQTDKYANLNQLLIKFSEVFYTDINLYNPEGGLLATSRFEIFDLGLQGQVINPEAMNKMYNEKRALFIHREKIGELGFLSAYVPFYNARGQLLAYLNLPYFTKEKDLQASLSTLIVTIVNIYVILILITIVLTILISDQVTRPLELLQLRFRELKLGNKYELLVYKGHDEIGGLVKEYNKMVLELESNVKLLARSERESAWREMAKQIAHEIKNPLTPMRLSIQQLNKLWHERPEEFDRYLHSVSTTLIEQIDNLSSIASEFSNFAKMPVAKFEKTDIESVLRSATQLFEGNKNVAVRFESLGEKVFVNADKEQLSRVFINIIKNGIQSIPESREGRIDLKLNTVDQFALVSIRDNGKGIPEEIRSKLFIPNFTTKTSGMGLGLAIVKNIVEHMKGEIDFETSIGNGSVFILKFPLFSE